MSSTVPGATTSYTVGFEYNTITTVGSIDMLFCSDPIPTDPCNPPAGLNVANAILSSQSGETGYSISRISPNHIVLSRTPTMVGSEMSNYTFSNIVNPTDTSQSFSIRLSDYASTDASGPIIDLGSILGQVTPTLTLEAQVPPILIFCLGQQVSQDCSQVTGTDYTNLGDLQPDATLTTTSQMAVGTNASSGYTITVNGTTLSAGNNGITPIPTATPSIPGINQFGLNLVANTQPAIGNDPDGASNNAQLGSNYGIPNEFAYNDGDVVASAPNVSLVKRYTVSYIVNSAANLSPGVYTTTITFVCTGRF
jgi:hypothetical protein